MSTAILHTLPPGFLTGLEEADQEAIQAIVGQPVTFVGYDRHGHVELEFTDIAGVYHSIWVDPSFVTF